jgi:tetratricopeptide (TPR) repeat protein
MDGSVTSREKKSCPKLISACIVAVALVVMPFLMGQEEDRPQTRARAMALEQEGQNAEAERIWEGMVKVDPRDAEALAHLGLLEARQERYEAAINYYRRAMAINSELPSLQMNLGLALFKVAQFPDAIKTFSSEIRKHPGDLRLTILLGMAHYGMKDYLVAIPYLQHAAEHEPQNLTLRMTLAHSCLRSRQYQCVLTVHEQIMALKGESAEADMLAGEALDRMGNRAGAEKAFRSAVALNPKEPDVHFGLGYLLWNQSKWADAAKEFQLELENNPQHVKARIYLADSWLRQNEIAEALPELEKLVAGDQLDPLAHLDLGLIYAKSSRNADAIRELKMAIESDPSDAEPHLLVAKVYRSMGRRDEANEELGRAGKLPPRNPLSLEELIDSIETPAP